ncbi:MAG TPA: hypothetical protein VGH93_00115 [Solirubrobacteraceae bacterium]
MGLLDDAIREHLELKRRRGADPGEVAREQRDALDVEEPVASEAGLEPGLIEADGAEIEGERPADGSGVPVGDEVPQAQELADVESPGADHLESTEDAGRPQAGSPGAAGYGLASTLGEETAEIDMQSVLDQGDDPARLSSPAPPEFTDAPGRGFEQDPSYDEPRGEDDERADVQRPIPGQERLSFE